MPLNPLLPSLPPNQSQNAVGRLRQVPWAEGPDLPNFACRDSGIGIDDVDHFAIGYRHPPAVLENVSLGYGANVLHDFIDRGPNRTSSRVMWTYESLEGSFHLPCEGRSIVFAVAASPIPLEPLCPVAGLTARKGPA